MEHYYKKILGWADESVERMYRRAVAQAHALLPSTFVELGTYCGKSAAACGVEIVNSKKPIILLCVDDWKWTRRGYGGKRGGILTGEEAMKDARKNLRPLLELGVVVILREDSADAADEFAPGGVDMVYVDASHGYEAVKRDLEAWLPKVRSGGLISGHDYNRKSWPGVVRAVDEVVGAVELDASVWWWRKP